MGRLDDELAEERAAREAEGLAREAHLPPAWGALAPLTAQLAPSSQPDSRTRAMALSALANFSFVDAAALAAAGLPARLGPLLFDADASTLGMALTALSNLVSDAADAAIPHLLSSGAPLAVFSPRASKGSVGPKPTTQTSVSMRIASSYFERASYQRIDMKSHILR